MAVALLRVGPPGPVQTGRVGQTEAEDGLDLAERRAPFQLRWVSGEKMAVQRRVFAPRRGVAYEPVSGSLHVARLGKVLLACASMGALLSSVNERALLKSLTECNRTAYGRSIVPADAMDLARR